MWTLLKLVVAGGVLLAGGGTAMAADPRHPVVQGYGAISPMPDAKERPDHALRYRVLFSVTKAPSAPDQANPGLEKVARFLNLLGADGVRPAPGDVAVIIYGPATLSVMTDAAYTDRTKAARNPNLPLIAALRAAGVSVRVCSQALVGNNIAPATVDKGVEIDVSGLTTMATLQLRGWALIPD
ncbi:DsrE family protein [Sphingomonadaceae bacterium jetA1]|jgi:intracellular sulfur oxidation DsrE/DsrF family protein|uniref:DsrE family protein n=1 Tax=Facivitalis istanbulensis TaxID=3075838 RepID=UPI003478A27B